jgi:hypothetical protein
MRRVYIALCRTIRCDVMRCCTCSIQFHQLLRCLLLPLLLRASKMRSLSLRLYAIRNRRVAFIFFPSVSLNFCVGASWRHEPYPDLNLDVVDICLLFRRDECGVDEDRQTSYTCWPINHIPYQDQANRIRAV